MMQAAQPESRSNSGLPQNLIRPEQNNTLLLQIVFCLRSFQVLARHTRHTENCEPWYNPQGKESP